MGISLKDKVALVTGSSAGLGAAVVRKLAAEGCHITINYVSRKSVAEELAEEVTAKYGVRTLVLQGDATKKESIANLVESTVQHFGKLNLVVSNAGGTRFVDFEDLDELKEDDFEYCFNINVISHFTLFKLAKPYLEKNEDGGSFVATASVAGLKASGSSIAYSCSKASLIRLVQSLAKSQGRKIRVNAICPGLLLTEWGMKFGEEAIAKIEAGLPLKHAPEIDDTADAFIAVLKNGSQTGCAIPVDSGAAIV